MSFYINRIVDSILCIIYKQNQVNPACINDLEKVNSNKLIKDIDPLCDYNYVFFSDKELEDLKTIRSLFKTNNFFK